MPNTFISLNLGEDGGPGPAAVVGMTGHPKTFVVSGPVAPGSRYVVEGSNDGGSTWDILIDDDGTQTLFTSPAAGAKTVDCIIEQVRVRAAGPTRPGPHPTITMGAPPVEGRAFFGKLDVPKTPGLGTPLDIGVDVGPLKTFIMRGPVRPGSRYTVHASMDGTRFDEVALFSADQQGALSKEVMCRYLRVHSAVYLDPPPAIAVGAEGLWEPGQGGGGGGGGGDDRYPRDISVASDRTYETSTSEEELFAEYVVPLALLGAPALEVDFGGTAWSTVTGGKFRVRLGGISGRPDGHELTSFGAAITPSSQVATSKPFPRPSYSNPLVKVTAEAPQDARATLRSFTLVFRPATPGS